MRKTTTKASRDWADQQAVSISPLVQATRDPDADAIRVGKILSLTEFVKAAWHVVEPGNVLLWNWHIEAICEHLEAVTRGEIKELMITIPPGHMKSLVVSVMWPAWMWTVKPSIKFLSCSYSMDLATRDSVRSRDIIDSEWFKETFMPSWRLKEDQNVKTRYTTTAGGGRQSLSTTSQGTGFRGDGWIVDDPINARDVLEGKINVDDALNQANYYIGKVLSTRLNDVQNYFKVIVMQRLHENDCVGYFRELGTFDELSLPAEFVPEQRTTTSIGWTDPRTEAGQLLFPRKFPRSELDKFKNPQLLGEATYQAQYQQDPTPSKGDVFSIEWFDRWTELPEKMEKIISVDCTFKAKKNSDFVVMQVWGAFKNDRFLIEEIRAKMTFTETKDTLVSLYNRHRDCSAVIVEDAANGPAIIDALNLVIPIIKPITPLGSKLARAMSVQPIAEAGLVSIPAKWTDAQKSGWLKEIAGFPKTKHDDRVDAMTQALAYMRRFVGAVSVPEASDFLHDQDDLNVW